MKPYLETVQAVIHSLEVEPKKGLSASQVKTRLQEYGPNELQGNKKTPLIKRFLAQLADPMLILLICAAAVSGVIGAIQKENNTSEVIIILFVVIINAVLGVAQESKAEAALDALKKMAAATSHVLRSGTYETVESTTLVPGDIVLLEAGDAVPADCRIIEAAQFKVEESALTGESVPVEKEVEALTIATDGNTLAADSVPLGDRVNMVYSGSSVVYGRATVVVVATGMHTEMGKIATSISEAKSELTPLQVKLNELSKILTIGVLIICAVIFSVSFLRHGAEFLQDPELLIETFMVAVSLAVAAIPEGLAAVVTIVLSLGVTRMSKRAAIVRKLTAVETLGCTQVICSDKTGTLTQNRMTVVRHVAEDEETLLRGMALCSDARWDASAQIAKGEPTEAALVADAAKAGMESADLDASWTRIGEAPFDSMRKMMSVVVEGDDGNIVQFSKGAPDEVLRKCTHILDEDGVRELDDAARERILAANKEMADDALRVLALAMRNWKSAPTSDAAQDLERDLTFVGLSGMIDPVRPEVGPSIAEAKAAGIRVVMITGDHIDTAIAIARELGIIEKKSQAITGAQLERMSDEELARKIGDYGVYARVQPEHKVRIVEAWKAQDKIVAMTGDGVNDAPSIKRADIGIGMGITGTDVTKNVADMVLADDNFATIVSAVGEGRRIYDNIRKSIQFLLSSNIAEVIVVFVATLIGFTILEPVQLLWINLMTDTFPALALGLEVAEPNIMKRKPRRASDGIFANGMGVDVVFQGIVISVITLISYFIGHYIEFGTADIAQVIADPKLGKEGITMAFLTLSMVEMFHSFNMRSRRQSLFKMGTHNKWLWASFAVSLVLTTCVVEIPLLSSLFGFAELDARNYFCALALAFIIIPIMEIYKACWRAYDRRIQAKQ